ncbi:MAG: Lrp/AsnC ligand binding domain-containing protein, partial [Acidiferrobacterales bacterium]|nr:Lrp/AsnC ligand binding domain-containing protein [Acidiferrobacterales bacterium]
GFAAHMIGHEDVLECHHVTGDETFIIKVKTAGTGSLEKILAEIRSMEGVTRTVTKVVLSTSKEGHLLDLEETAGIMPSKAKDSVNGRDKRSLALNSGKKHL